MLANKVIGNRLVININSSIWISWNNGNHTLITNWQLTSMKRSCYGKMSAWYFSHAAFLSTRPWQAEKVDCCIVALVMRFMRCLFHFLAPTIGCKYRSTNCHDESQARYLYIWAHHITCFMKIDGKGIRLDPPALCHWRDLDEDGSDPWAVNVLPESG